MTTQDALRFAARKLRHCGPDRVLVDAEGHAVPPRKARDDFGISPTVVLIRDDGWMLGAPISLVELARGLWEKDWIGFMRRPETFARPMDEWRTIYGG